MGSLVIRRALLALRRMPDSPSDQSMPAGSELGAFGKYNLIASLGQGGMANVFLALMAGPSGFHKLQVIKIMRQDLLAGSAETTRMFMAEARLAARLVHPNIVHTYEVGEYEGRHYIAMEYLDGQPLSTLLNRARGDQEIPLAEYLRLIAELARGLHHAHTLRGFQGEHIGVVHRDVSPQNVIVTYDGQVKLLDFGIAKAADAEHMTAFGMIKGKLDYIAPEQLRSETVDGRADVFALGAMLWEVISGHRFAGGRKVSDINKIQARVSGTERKLRSLRPDVPASLERIVERATALDPNDRFDDAAELADALDTHLDEMGLRAGSRSLGQHVSALFSSERVELHKLIDEQIQRVKRGSNPPAVVASTAPRNKISQYLSDHHLDERSSIRQLAHALSSAPAPSSSLASWLAVLMGALALGASAMWLIMGKSKQAVAPAPLPAVVAPMQDSVAPARPVSASPKQNVITVRVIVDPPQARVSLDGVPLSLPFQGAFAKDDANHRVEASAEGFRPLKQFVAFDGDRELLLRLERIPGARKGVFERADRPGFDTPASAGPTKKASTAERPNPYDE